MLGLASPTLIANCIEWSDQLQRLMKYIVINTAEEKRTRKISIINLIAEKPELYQESSRFDVS